MPNIAPKTLQRYLELEKAGQLTKRQANRLRRYRESQPGRIGLIPTLVPGRIVTENGVTTGFSMRVDHREFNAEIYEKDGKRILRLKKP